MPPRSHAVVWIDHHEARIIFFNPFETETEVVHPADRTRHIHSKAGSRDHVPAKEDRAYYDAVCQTLAEAGEILVTGPANAKTELVKHMHAAAGPLIDRLAGVETLDHVTDGQLLAEARRHFHSYDRARPLL